MANVNIVLNLSGNDDELLNLYAMVFSFCLTSEIQTGLSTGMMAQIKYQIQNKCRLLIEAQGMNWEEYLKELEKPVREQLDRMK